MHAKAFVILSLSIALSGSVILGPLQKKNTVGGSLPISELTHLELQALAEQSSDPLVAPAIYEQAFESMSEGARSFQRSPNSRVIRDFLPQGWRQTQSDRSPAKGKRHS